jgi:sigma-B regulation protein RsbU (phosphoserine phosphatase)
VATFKIQSGTGRGKRLRILRDRLVIGRHPGCDIVFESAAVSRQHAEVIRDGAALWIADLRSRNGTLVNGRQISDRHRLEDGDEIVIGDQKLAFSATRGRAGPRSPLDESGIELDGGGPIELTDEVADANRDADEAALDDLIVSRVMVDATPRASARYPETTLRAVVDLHRAIGGSLSLDEVLPRLLDGLLAIFPQAARGFVFLPASQSQRFVLRSRRFRGPPETGPLRLSLSLITRVARSREAILSADAVSDSRFSSHESLVISRIRSVMCVPVIGPGDGLLAVVQVDTANIRPGFTKTDLELLVGITADAAQVIAHALAHDERVIREQINRDLELAHRVQQGLLPACPPEIPGYAVFDYYEAARHVGGDFFGYVPLTDGRLAVALADVSGKGVAAALLMAAVSSDVRYCLASDADVGRAVARMNESFLRGGWDDRFATLIVAVLDPATHRITLCNAGHLPVLARRADGTVQELAGDLGGLPLGMASGSEYGTCEIELAPGDAIVLCTDGITEALDHEMNCYGLDRLARVIKKPVTGVAELGRRILADVDRHAAGQLRSDDICLVCLGRLADS